MSRWGSSALAWIDDKTRRERPARRPTRAGWYDDPERPGIERYWSSDDWDDTIAPRPKPESTTKSARVIALGILAALAAAWFIYNLSQPSDLDCSIQRLEYSTGERAIYNVDDACR